MTTLITKRGNGVPTAANLVEGEQAIDLQTGRVYTLSGGVVIECGQDTHDIDFHTDVDTTTTSPGDGDVLTYDGATNVWMPQAPSGGSSVDKPYITSPENGAVDVNDPYVFLSTTFGSNVGSAHLSSDWVIFSDSSLTTVVYSINGVTGTEKTRLTTATGLADGTTHYVQVRYNDNLGNSSDYSQPVSFTTTAFDTVIYEHNFSSVPVRNANGTWFSIQENGYTFNWFASFNGGQTSNDPYTHRLGTTNNIFDGNDPMIYRMVYGNSTQFTPPANVGEWYWKFRPTESLADANFPPLHRKYFDTADPNYTPALGFKWTFHRWHNMSRYPANSQVWQNRRQVTGGTFNQSYHAISVSSSDQIVSSTPTTVVTSGYDGGGGAVLQGGQWDWMHRSPKTGTTAPKAQGSIGSQAWFYALKKIELVVP